MKDSIAYFVLENEGSLDSLNVDSTAMARIDTPVIKEVIPVFFTNQASQIQAKTLANIDRAFDMQNDWFTLVILTLVVYLIIVKLLYHFDIVENMRGLFKIHGLDNVGFEKQTQFTGYLLAPLALFVYTFYLYFLLNSEFLSLQLDHLYAVFAVFAILVFAIKYLFEKTISIIFGAQKNFNLYFADHLFMLGISSFIQTPLLVFYFYSKVDFFLWVSLSVLIILWLFRLLRGFIIGFNQTTFYKSYIFLYLCSLEILPVIVAYKWVIG